MQISRIAIISLLLNGCSTTPYWHDDIPGYRVKNIEIHESETLIIDCRAAPDWKGSGCIQRLQDRAIIYIRKGLSQTDYECTMRHEFEHALGKGHGQGVVYKKMCE